ncbi:MAG TPA: hypothetical protein VD995_09230 [Azospirillum sp.]|nr:hypothetical protein [Azospirillum sp.]
MTTTPAFFVDFQDAGDVAGKRRMLRGWTVGALRATLQRNRMELLDEPDSTRCRQILSGSILIRCELAQRRTDAVLDAVRGAIQDDGALTLQTRRNAPGV